MVRAAEARRGQLPTSDEQHLLRRRLIGGGHFVAAHKKERPPSRAPDYLNSFAQLHGDNRCTPYLVDRNTGPAAEKDEASNLCSSIRTFLQRLASRVATRGLLFESALMIACSQ
jgi:hypothetical protein